MESFKFPSLPTLFTLNVLHGHPQKLCKVLLMNIAVFGTLSVSHVFCVIRFLSCSTVVISTGELFIRHSSSLLSLSSTFNIYTRLYMEILNFQNHAKFVQICVLKRNPSRALLNQSLNVFFFFSVKEGNIVLLFFFFLRTLRDLLHLLQYYFQTRRFV